MNMQVTILLAQCTASHLTGSLSTVSKVLEELEIKVNKIDLMKFPYFNGVRTKEIDQLMEQLKESKGVIMMSNVPMLSLHGAMQTFFEWATLYEASYFSTPILAITYSEWLGEVEAAESILKMWNVLGGNDGIKLCMNKGTPFEAIKERVERIGEDFYRIMKQERESIASTERQVYTYLKSGQSLNNSRNLHEIESHSPAPQKDQEVNENKVEVKSLTDILKGQGNKVNLSTKEQTIKEITSLLKKQVNKEEGKEQDEFVTLPAGIYKKPTAHSPVPVMPRYLQQIPHYFIAQYDKELDLTIRYTITDSNEKGYILVREGDCSYIEDGEFSPTVDLCMAEDTLMDLMKKRMTYQKAFMLGKLKVKGNFAILPKIDQIFTAM